MSDLPDSVQKYLNKFSCSNWKAHISKDSKYKMIVVVPAVKEYHNIKKLLHSLINNGNKHFSNTLILLVINNLKSSIPEVKEDNALSLELMQRIINSLPKDKFEKSVIESGLNFGFIDCSSGGNELPEKEGGVGLARKIGMDAALKYFDYSSPLKNILACLDADCSVSKNYLSTIFDEFNKKNISAGYVKFEHCLPNDFEQQKAIMNYEIFLHYYVLGLKYAGSPYAFFTIGSTMLCDVEFYMKIGGMNKRKAAEDFYFMEKLSKISKIYKIEGTAVYPSPRRSWRVPFGTGQRVNRFLSKVQNEYLLYNPKSFIVLKAWLKIFTKSVFKDSSNYILSEAGKISTDLKTFLEINSFSKNWDNIRSNSKTEIQLHKQKQYWFDGFKTLKLIHYLRDNGFPLVNTSIAVEKLMHLCSANEIDEKIEDVEIPSIENLKKYLYLLKKETQV